MPTLPPALEANFAQFGATAQSLETLAAAARKLGVGDWPDFSPTTWPSLDAIDSGRADVWKLYPTTTVGRSSPKLSPEGQLVDEAWLQLKNARERIRVIAAFRTGHSKTPPNMKVTPEVHIAYARTNIFGIYRSRGVSVGWVEYLPEKLEEELGGVGLKLGVGGVGVLIFAFAMLLLVRRS